MQCLSRCVRDLEHTDQLQGRSLYDGEMRSVGVGDNQMSLIGCCNELARNERQPQADRFLGAVCVPGQDRIHIPRDHGPKKDWRSGGERQVMPGDAWG